PQAETRDQEGRQQEPAAAPQARTGGEPRGRAAQRIRLRPQEFRDPERPRPGCHPPPRRPGRPPDSMTTSPVTRRATLGVDKQAVCMRERVYTVTPTRASRRGGSVPRITAHSRLPWLRESTSPGEPWTPFGLPACESPCSSPSASPTWA